MEGIDIGKLAAGMAQVLQCFPAFEHLLHGIGAEKIIVNVVQFVRVSRYARTSAISGHHG